MRTTIAICTITLMAFISGGCRKEGTNHFVSSETKAWTLFDEGSYWIYRNDSTLDLDSSVIALPPKFYLVGHKETDLDRYEHILVFYRSALINGGEIYTGGADYDKYFIAFGNDRLVPAYLSWALVDSVIWYWGDFILEEKLSDYSFEGMIFPEVQHSMFTDYIDSLDTIHFILAKNVGLIKMYGKWNDTTRSWSLIRYHVVQD